MRKFLTCTLFKSVKLFFLNTLQRWILFGSCLPEVAVVAIQLLAKHWNVEKNRSFSVAV